MTSSDALHPANASQEDDFTDIELADLDDQPANDFGAAATGEPLAEPTEPLTEFASVDPEVVQQDDEQLPTDGSAGEPVDERLADAQAEAARLRTFAEQLSQLEDAELGDHVEYYQHAHAELQRALSDVDNS